MDIASINDCAVKLVLILIDPLFQPMKLLSEYTLLYPQQTFC